MNNISTRDGLTPRWGMVVDVNRCVGCQTCTVACKHANDTVPGVQWRRVLDVETGTYPDVERVFLVTGCQHCAEPSCVPVCPTGATKQRADGLVTMDYDLCIGCASCAVACPYQARTIVHDKRFYYEEETLQEKTVAHDDRLGVAQKCTFCIDRVDDGLEDGLTPGEDWSATPACSAACIASAIKFGDFNDPDSEVSKLTEEGSYFQMHAELGNDPQIKYLYETPSVPGRDAQDADMSDEALTEPDNPLTGQVQTYWDLRAAMNFIMGGFGAGLIIMAYFTHVAGGLDEAAMIKMFAGAGAIIAIGLFFVWLKIGRKLRALYVILRPQSSWMSREVYAVAILFGAGLADFVFPFWALHTLVAAAALVFLYCQARILHASKGIPSWRVPAMPWMLMASGLLEGVGLVAIILAISPQNMSAPILLPVTGLVLIAVNAILWRNYVSNAKTNGIGPHSRIILFSHTLKVHAIVHLFPALLFIAVIALPTLPPMLLGAAGVLILIGGAYWKGLIITRACHQQGFALAKFPQRGSGKYSAPTLGA